MQLSKDIFDTRASLCAELRDKAEKIKAAALALNVMHREYDALIDQANRLLGNASEEVEDKWDAKPDGWQHSQPGQEVRAWYQHLGNLELPELGYIEVPDLTDADELEAAPLSLAEWQSIRKIDR